MNIYFACISADSAYGIHEKEKKNFLKMMKHH